MRQEDLDLTLDEPFIPFTPIKAFPKNEHGDVYPTKKCRSFDYEKEAKAIYRPKTFFFKLRRFFTRLTGIVVGHFVVYFRYHLKVEGRRILKTHKRELKNGFLTVANHVFPIDCVAVTTIRHFRVPEFPVWQDGFESNQGAMFQAFGGFPVVKTPCGLEKAYQCMKDVLKEKKWLHVYPEAACWYYYVPIREFLNGTFRLAYEMDTPVFPLVFSFRKRTGFAKIFFPKEPLITLRIGEPHYPDKSLEKSLAIVKLRDEVHLSMVHLEGITNEARNAELKKRYSYR
jgi:1-acyl-sn-glycerol-3-phosphate acyltransferase